MSLPPGFSLIEAGEEEVAGGLQMRGEGGHIGQEDVAVDVGQDDVGLRRRGQAAGIAVLDIYHGPEAVGVAAVVDVVVVLGVADAPLVDVVGHDGRCSPHGAEYAEYAGAAACIDDRGAVKVGIQQLAQHEACRGMRARSEGLTRMYGDVDACRGIVGGILIVDDDAVAYDNRLEALCLPGGVPVLVGDGRGGVAHVGVCEGETLDDSPDTAVVVESRGHISLQTRRLGHEAVAACISKGGCQHIGGGLTIGIYYER